ncbi:hypothetical protein ACH4GM_31515 [Streptomyces coeruleorubidus]|uniref:hypothetical protein n=1 Tax=Streptomyces coeruleorubidus TaxID=116188 RepID=UPI00379E8130
MRYSRGQLRAEPAQHPEYDPQKLFAQATLQGLRAKLSGDADPLDDYLPPHIAERSASRSASSTARARFL